MCLIWAYTCCIAHVVSTVWWLGALRPTHSTFLCKLGLLLLTVQLLLHRFLTVDHWSAIAQATSESAPSLHLHKLQSACNAMMEWPQIQLLCKVLSSLSAAITEFCTCSYDRTIALEDTNATFLSHPICSFQLCLQLDILVLLQSVSPVARSTSSST